jgi:methylmalonyl-CoA mutase
VQRNREAWNLMPDQMPIFGTMASRFNDDGVTALYQAVKVRLAEKGLPLTVGRLPLVEIKFSTHQTPVVPAARTRYMAEITDTVRGYKARARAQARLARELQQLGATAQMLADDAAAQHVTRSGAKNTVLRLADERALKQDPAAAKLPGQRTGATRPPQPWQAG